MRVGRGYLQHVEKQLLPQPSTILEEDVLGKGAIDVAVDLLSMRRWLHE